MRIVFMGTPEFAVGPLKALCEAGHEVCAVVTQPDRPKGRGKGVRMSPVKEAALQQGIEVFQPERIKREEAVRRIASYRAEVYVVAAFGQILSQEILDQPRYGCVNIHASLLPKYRGAAPIQWAVLNGESVTGVTTMRMNAGLDTGDILMARQVALARQETADSLYEKLSAVGSGLILETLRALQAGTLTPLPQNDQEATYAPMIRKEMGRMDFRRPAQELERLARGMNSWPSAYTSCQGKTLKVWRAEVVKISEPMPGEIAPAACGMVLSVDRDSFTVLTGDGGLKILEVQLEGKKRMSAHDFLLGCRLQKGDLLGETADRQIG